MKMVTLEKDYTIKLSSVVVDYIYPDYVFVPIFDDYKLLTKNNDLVKKEQLLLSNENHPGIYSPISGRVVGAKDCILSDGKRQKCIVIENDFKEKKLSRSTMRDNLRQISKDEFLGALKRKLLASFEDSKTLLFKKFEIDKIENILLSGIVDEPYIATDLFLLNNFSSEILETLSFLSKIYKTKNNVIVLKNSDRENVEKYTSILGTYPELSLNILPEVYPLQKNNLFLKHIGCENESNLIVYPSELLSIYNILKKNKLTTEKYITITGNAIENPIVINVKLGASVKNIIEEHIKYLNNDEVCFAVNGLMCGNILGIEDLIVTNDLEGIIINFKKEISESECINCGKCYEVCPVNIDPKKTFYRKMEHGAIKQCINCGLCTYICPSFINFRKRIEAMKNE